MHDFVKKSPLCVWVACFMCGIVFREGLAFPWPLCALACPAALVYFVFRPRKRVAAWIALGLLWFLAGCLRAGLWWDQPHVALWQRLQQAPIRAEWTLCITEIEDASVPHAYRSQARLLGYKTPEGSWRSASGSVHMRLNPADRRWEIGACYSVSGAVQALPGQRNPNGWDRSRYFLQKKIVGRLDADIFGEIRRLEYRMVSGPSPYLRRMRQLVLASLSKSLDPDSVNFLRAVLLGEKGVLEAELKASFIETGTVHLLVVSGFHVGLVALFIELGFRLFGVPYRIRLLLNFFLLWLFAALTGMQPPVFRATVMASVLVAARFLDRSFSVWNALALAALVILILDPQQCLQTGFQLSFGAVAGLLLGAEPCAQWIEKRIPGFVPRWAARYGAASFAASLCVLLWIGPILAHSFHRIAWVSLLANGIAVPWVSLLVALGLFALILSTLGIPLQYGIAPLLQQGVLGLNSVLALIARLPGAMWVTGAFPAWLCLPYYALLACVWHFLRRHKPSRRQWLLGCLSILLAMQLIGAGTHLARSRLELVFIDVGHGDSVYIRTPRGQVWLVDAGKYGAGYYAVLPFLYAERVRGIDVLVLTHEDEDHIGGALALLDRMPIRLILTNGIWGDTASAAHLRQKIASKKIPVVTVAQGLELQSGDGVVFRFMHPPRENPNLYGNDASLVLQIAYGEHRFQLSGDLEERGIPYFLQAHCAEAMRPLTLLQMPHHGSRLGTWTDPLLSCLRPAAAVVSVGRQRGTPSAHTLQALQRHGVPYFTTRDCGALRVTVRKTVLLESVGCGVHSVEAECTRAAFQEVISPGTMGTRTCQTRKPVHVPNLSGPRTRAVSRTKANVNNSKLIRASLPLTFTGGFAIVIWPFENRNHKWKP